ncbi:MAG: hypothetical protein AB7F75_13560, partial [Planctomycetota bacterium]
LAWSDATLNYSAPLDKVRVTGQLDPVTQELKDLKISFGWGPLVSAEVVASGSEKSWKADVKADVNLQTARQALKVAGLEDIKVAEGSKLSVDLQADGGADGHLNAKGGISGPLKVNHPAFSLDEPLSLLFKAHQSKGKDGPLLSLENLDLTLGTSASPVARVEIRNVKPAPAGGLLPLPFEGTLEAKLGSEGLLRVGGEKARAALGKLELSGDINLKVSKSAIPDDLNVSCQLKDSTIYLGDLLHKDAGVPLGLSFASKTGAFGIDLGGQSLKGLVDLQKAKIDLNQWHLELEPLTTLFPVIAEYAPKGAVELTLKASAPEALEKLKAPRAEGVAAPTAIELAPLAELEGSMSFKGVSAKLPGPRQALPVKLDGALAWSKPKGEELPSATLKGFALGAGRTDLSLDGSIQSKGSLMEVNLSGKGSMVDLDELQAHFKTEAPAAPPAGDKPATTPSQKSVASPPSSVDEGAIAKLLENRSVKADLTLDKVLASNIEVQNARLAFNLKGGVATLEELSGKVSKGTVKASAMKSFVGNRDLTFKSDIKDLELTQDLVSQGAEGSWILALVRDLVYKLVPGVTGTLGGKMELASRGINPPELIEAAKGLVDLTVKDARVTNPEHFVKVGSLLRGAAVTLTATNPEKAKQLQKIGDLLANPKYDTVTVKTEIGSQVAEVALDLKSSQGHPGLKVRGRIFLEPQNPAASKCRFVVTPTELSASDQANVTEICQLAYGEDGFVLGPSLDALTIEMDMKVVAKLAVGGIIKKKLGEKVPGAGDVIEGLGDLFKKKEKPPEDDEYDDE